MQQRMKVRKAGLMSLCYEAVAERSAALFANTLEVKRDLPISFRDKLPELAFRVQSVKLLTFRSQPLIREKAVFEMRFG